MTEEAKLPRPSWYGSLPAWLQRGGVLATGAAALLMIVVSRHVLEGQSSLVQGAILPYCCRPWLDVVQLRHANPLLSDPVQEMLPWLQVVKSAYAHGQLPLWNPLAQMGSPLLADDQSASLSPFTILALPFSPAVGISLAMLAKLWVGGIGTALFVRRLGARGITAAIAGIAYAGSSFLGVWLAWPHASVASLMPWAFFGVEWYVQTRRFAAFCTVAIAIALQFLAGHSETSLHFGLALIIYTVVRVVAARRSALSLAGALAAAAVIGTLMAGVQLVPFLHQLGELSIISKRSTDNAGLLGLPATDLTTWLIPNLHGNPALNGSSGALPNYNEGTGFATVTALLLSPLGAWLLWQRRQRAVLMGLGAVLFVSAATAYGLLTPLTGRLPLLSVSVNLRFLSVCCFVMATLGGLGAEALLRLRWRRLANGRLLVAVGGATVGVLAAFDIVVFHAASTGTLPRDLGVWFLAAAGITIVAVLAFAGAVVSGVKRAGMAGLIAVVLIEAASFTLPYNPENPIDYTPPANPAINWLVDHQGSGYVAPLGSVLIPETASYFGIRDIRSYDLGALTDRFTAFWSHADPGFDASAYTTYLRHPDVRWLAAAGVRYVVMPSYAYPGTTPVVSLYGVAVSAVPGAQPFAALQASVTAPDEQAALTALNTEPAASVTVEGDSACCTRASPAAGSSAVLDEADASSLRVETAGGQAATLVIRQAFADGWQATVDGSAAQIRPADVLFDAVEVPAGRHTVELRYAPASVTQGVLLSIAGGTGLLLMAAVIWLRRRTVRSRTAEPGSESRRLARR